MEQPARQARVPARHLDVSRSLAIGACAAAFAADPQAGGPVRRWVLKAAQTESRISTHEPREPSMRRLLESSKRNVVVLTVVALGAVALLAVSSIVVASHELTKSADRQVQTTAAGSSVVIGPETSN